MGVLPSRNEALDPSLPPSKADYRAISRFCDQLEVWWPGGRELRSHCAKSGIGIVVLLSTGPLSLCTIGCVFYVSISPSTLHPHTPLSPSHDPQSWDQVLKTRRKKPSGRGLCVLLISYLFIVTLFSLPPTQQQPIRLSNPTHSLSLPSSSRVGLLPVFVIFFNREPPWDLNIASRCAVG